MKPNLRVGVLPSRPQTAVIHPVSQRAVQRSWPSQHSLLPCIISSVSPRGYLTKRRRSPAHLLLNISFLLPVGQWFDLHDVCSCRVQMWALLSCMAFTKSHFLLITRKPCWAFRRRTPGGSAFSSSKQTGLLERRYALFQRVLKKVVVFVSREQVPSCD